MKSFINNWLRAYRRFKPKQKMSKFKISGQERRELKKLLNEYKSYEKGFWHYHQLDKDMYSFISPDKKHQPPMSYEEAQKRYDKVVRNIERITKELE